MSKDKKGSVMHSKWFILIGIIFIAIGFFAIGYFMEIYPSIWFFIPVIFFLGAGIYILISRYSYQIKYYDDYFIHVKNLLNKQRYKYNDIEYVNTRENDWYLVIDNKKIYMYRYFSGQREFLETVKVKNNKLDITIPDATSLKQKIKKRIDSIVLSSLGLIVLIVCPLVSFPYDDYLFYLGLGAFILGIFGVFNLRDLFYKDKDDDNLR